MNFLNLLRSFNNTQSVKKPFTNGVNGDPLTRGKGVLSWEYNQQQFQRPQIPQMDNPPWMKSSYPNQLSIFDKQYNNWGRPSPMPRNQGNSYAPTPPNMSYRPIGEFIVNDPSGHTYPGTSMSQIRSNANKMIPPQGILASSMNPGYNFDINTIVPQIDKGVDNTAPTVDNNATTVDNTAVKRALNNNSKFGGLSLFGSDNRSSVERAMGDNGNNNGSGDFADYMNKISDLESTKYSDAAKKADVYNKIGAGIGLGANLLGVMNALNSKEPDQIMTPAQNTVKLRKDQSAFINYQEGQAKQGSAAMSRLAKEMGADPLMTAGLLSRTYNDSMLKTHAQAEQMRNQTYNQEKQLNSNILANGAQLKTRTDLFNAQMIAQANAQRGKDLTASLAGLANILPGYGEAKFKNQLWANSLDDQVTNSRLSSYYGNY